MTDRKLYQVTLIALSALALVLSNRAGAALSFTVASDGWPDAARRNAAISAMQSAVNRYNAYGDFGDYNVFVYYNAGIPTAQANYLGSIGFGGTYPNERVTMHELAHYLGSGTYGDPWDGPRGEALVDQFDGIEATLQGDSNHFWPYGLNFDSEGSEINKQRHVAMLYAQRADMGIGSTANPWSATTVSLTASDPFGESGFNYKARWSDGYFAHAGADYHAGAFIIRTPESPNSFTFAGESLTLSNPAADTGLYYKGVGSTGVTTFKNLILDGGWVDHRSSNNLADLFQLAGKVTVSSASTIRAFNGDIDILADVTGNGDINIPLSSNPAENDRYVRFLSSNNSFAGSIINGSRFELANSANFTFDIGPAGLNNAIAGASARNTILNGVFEFDLTDASANVGDSWAVVTAANASYGADFQVAGFTNRSGVWRNVSYAFNPTTGLLTVIPTYDWDANGGGLWSIAGNWSEGVPPADEDVRFGAVLTAPNAPARITLDVPAQVNRVTFDNTNLYVIDGANALTLTGEAEIHAASGDHFIAAPIAGTAGLNYMGPGRVTLSSANPYGGQTNVRSGTLALSGAGSIDNSSRIDVHPGATLNATGLTGGLQLASGQTLVNNSNVVGSVSATSGSSVEGTGSFAGNLTAQAGSVVRVGGNGLSVVTPVVGQVRYIDAAAGPMGNTTRASGESFNPLPQNVTGADNDWELRTLGNGATAMEAGGEVAENAYELKTTVNGLMPYENYAVYAFFWDPTSSAEDWNIRAGMASSPSDKVLYAAADATSQLGGAIAAPLASTLTLTTPPLLNEGNRTLLAAPLGTRAADANGRIEVFIDDMPSTIGPNGRTWYDGLGVAQIGHVTMMVQGNYTQENGATLVMDILNPLNHDKLVVSGTFTAGGSLQIVQIAGAAALSAGDAFDLLDFTAASGSFASFDLPPLLSELAWDTSRLYTTGQLRVVHAGDFNDDGIVNGDDLNTWRTGFGRASEAAHLHGDANGDGDVDGNDFLAWQRKNGSRVSASPTGVPEPTAITISAMAALAVVGCHQRQRLNVIA